MLGSLDALSTFLFRGSLGFHLLNPLFLLFPSHLVRSNPPPEHNSHQVAPSNLERLEHDHRNLYLRRGDLRQRRKHDIRKRHPHSRSLCGHAIRHSDGVFLGEPEYGEKDAYEEPEEIIGDRHEHNEDHVVTLDICKCMSLKCLVEGLPYYN